MVILHRQLLSPYYDREWGEEEWQHGPLVWVYHPAEQPPRRDRSQAAHPSDQARPLLQRGVEAHVLDSDQHPRDDASVPTSRPRKIHPLPARAGDRRLGR